jgi:hypothetical protein
MDRVPGMRSDAPKRNVIVGLLTLLVCLLFGGFVQEALALPLLFQTRGRIRP